MNVPEKSDVCIHYREDGRVASVAIDGQPIAGVRSYQIRDGFSEATEVTVTFLASRVRIEKGRS